MSQTQEEATRSIIVKSVLARTLKAERIKAGYSSMQKLADEIEKRTSFSVSKNTIQKYEDENKHDLPNINYLVAFCITLYGTSAFKRLGEILDTATPWTYKMGALGETGSDLGNVKKAKQNYDETMSRILEQNPGLKDLLSKLAQMGDSE